MAFTSNGSFLPTTLTTGDPIVITANATVTPGNLALVWISHDSGSIDITSISDSVSNSWGYTRIVNSDGLAAIAYTLVTNQITSGSTQITVNYAASADSIIRGSSYGGLSASVVGSGSKHVEESGYSLGWSSSEAAVAFVNFSFPVDYGFSDTTISGWTNIFVTDKDQGGGLGQSQQAFYNEVSAGTNTASNTGPTLLYNAVGVSFSYARPTRGQAVTLL